MGAYRWTRVAVPYSTRPLRLSVLPAYPEDVNRSYAKAKRIRSVRTNDVTDTGGFASLKAERKVVEFAEYDGMA
jgi:hypothetical protein